LSGEKYLKDVSMEIERTLINLFHALEEEKITYSLLRGFE
jgi:hypothetical protein